MRRCSISSAGIWGRPRAAPSRVNRTERDERPTHARSTTRGRGHAVTERADIPALRQYFTGLQQRIVAGLGTIETKPFRRDDWQRLEGGDGIARLVEDGAVLERGGVNFSHVSGERLPPSASAHRPELAGRGFEVMG